MLLAGQVHGLDPQERLEINITLAVKDFSLVAMKLVYIGEDGDMLTVL